MADDRPLDDTDRTLLAELSVDGRASMRGLAQRLHISRANAYARVERLLRDQVIRGFAARIVSLSCCEKLQSVTSFPFSKSRSARAVPQPPLPTTAIFIVLTVPFILSAPSCDIRAAPEKRAGKWNICFSEAASRETAPRAFTPLGLS